MRDQARLIAAGELDLVELLAATLARLAERDGPLRSTPEVFPQQARQMLAAAPGGPLRGVPVTVKDMYSLPWRGARNGTRHELLPASASGLFRRVRDAGAIVVGLANQHELGLGGRERCRPTARIARFWCLVCRGGVVYSGVAGGEQGGGHGLCDEASVLFCWPAAAGDE